MGDVCTASTRSLTFGNSSSDIKVVWGSVTFAWAGWLTHVWLDDIRGFPSHVASYFVRGMSARGFRKVISAFRKACEMTQFSGINYRWNVKTDFIWCKSTISVLINMCSSFLELWYKKADRQWTDMKLMGTFLQFRWELAQRRLVLSEVWLAWTLIIKITDR